MNRNDHSKPTDTVTADIIPFPDKLAQRPQTARDKTGPRIFKLALLQALRKTKERVLRRTRSTHEVANCQENGGCNGSATTTLLRATG